MTNNDPLSDYNIIDQYEDGAGNLHKIIDLVDWPSFSYIVHPFKASPMTMAEFVEAYQRNANLPDIIEEWRKIVNGLHPLSGIALNNPPLHVSEISHIIMLWRRFHEALAFQAQVGMITSH